ncbi:MAG TPA: MaoC family dehydratase N-terminal domain-containing protein [Vitreimonas sp.]|uniref:FAS1-like dehydratase domain-containing protein n=1 Tax=Vitreimonas sp. TaxID=3069702 RepID=UPI002D515C59|nr:MaoC family dehydratase N-terminal domain-containing protein [Vitreimonas sp.]HYD89748.1 MaoC family dehydratase N-terminal domain-containing protein [Vitreimonas sp.]
MSAPDYSAWIGRVESKRDVIAPAPLRGLAALLDHDPERWMEGAIPPLAHWLYFLPTAPQSELGPDGHPARGGFLPLVALPRRMWAAGRMTFHAPLAVGDSVERTSTIRGVTEKAGSSGPLVFVTVAHTIKANGALAIEEEQDIVYRDVAPSAPKPLAPETKRAERERVIEPDPVLLFRYSALTFNAHRIHYDQAYAAAQEGYPELVAQGPLIATLLMDHYLRAGAAAAPRSFSFRAERPLFAGGQAMLCASGDELWCRNAAGETVMSAKVS